MAGLLFFCSMKNIIALVCIATSLWSCAQTGKVVSKAQAFYTIPMPGTIAVDMEGKPRPVKHIKVYRVIVEVKISGVEWRTAWADNRQFTIITQTINDGKLPVGRRRSDDSQINIEATKGTTLMQLELSPTDNYKPPPQLLKANELLLQGKLRGKLFYYKINKVTELASPEYQ